MRRAGQLLVRSLLYVGAVAAVLGLSAAPTASTVPTRRAPAAPLAATLAPVHAAVTRALPGPAAQTPPAPVGAATAGGRPSGSAAPAPATAPAPTVAPSAIPSPSASSSPAGARCQAPATPRASLDAPLDEVFSAQSGPGWVGGDASYSTALPDGEEAFDFSDTLIGTAQPDGRSALTGMPHSSEIIASPHGLRSDYDGTESAPQSLIPDAAGGGHWEVAATDVENGTQLIFVNQFAPVPNSPFGRYTGQAGIAVLSVASSGLPTFRALVGVPTDPSTQWGNAVMQQGSYTYVFGEDTDTTKGVFNGMKVARVPLGQAVDTAAWQYWNGSGWVSGEANAELLATGNELTGVTPLPGSAGLMAVSIPTGVYADRTVDVSYACAPQGPWSTPVPVYAIPQITQYPDEIAYIPTVHPELSSNGQLVVSYNVDSTGDMQAIASDVHVYQPRFLFLTPG